MRLSLAVAILVSGSSLTTAFVPVVTRGSRCLLSPLQSAVEEATSTTAPSAAAVDDDDDVNNDVEVPSGKVLTVKEIKKLSGEDYTREMLKLAATIKKPTKEEINSRLEKQLAKMKEKDATSKELSKEDIKVVFEDEHILIVDKPAGVLSIAKDLPSMQKAVFDAYGNADELPMGKMTVHRLGFDTSGLMVFARTMAAVRGMNTAFRTRKVERKYEALVCGTVEEDEGIINLPIMKDYECPPYVRISTHEHQLALMDLTKEDVGSLILERPKNSITKYEVIAREELDGQPVTRVSLTSVSGRYHQLNVHCAAFGHPIVGDTVYGFNGDALPQGGLTDAELEDLIPNPNRVSSDFQIKDKSVCVHATSISFKHPVTKQQVSVSSEARF